VPFHEYELMEREFAKACGRLSVPGLDEAVSRASASLLALQRADGHWVFATVPRRQSRYQLLGQSLFRAKGGGRPGGRAAHGTRPRGDIGARRGPLQ